MSIGRYTFARRINNGEGVSNPRVSGKIFRAIELGLLPYTVETLKSNQRLDVISFEKYGDPTYWWAIAAASGIGWGLQVPAGTIIRVPTNISDIIAIVR
jgi:hypothetical protein